MHFLKTLGLKTYYSVRRIGKALRNWRKFGVIIFGSLFVASTFMPASIFADDLRVEIYQNGLSLSSFSIDEGDFVQFSAKAYLGDQDVTSQTAFVWSINGLFKSTDVGVITQSGLYTTGETAGFYSAAVRLVGTYNSKSDLDTVSVTINSISQPPTISLDRVEILDTNNLALSSFSIDEGNSKQFKARAYDTNGDDVTSQTAFVWSINGLFKSTDVGVITQSGLYTTGETAGFYSAAVRLVGTYNSKSDLDTVSVTINSISQPPTISLDRVEIVNVDGLPLSSFSIDMGSSKQFDSRAYDTDGNDITAQTSFSWSIADNYNTYDVGVVSQNGLYITGNKTGFYSAAIQLAGVFKNKSDLDTVSVLINEEVLPVQNLTYVEISPTNVVLDANTTQQFSAKAYDQDNQLIIDGVNYSWSIVNGGGTINYTSGLFTAGSVDGIFSNTVRVRANMDDKTAYDYATVLINPIIIQSVLDRVEIFPSSITLNTNQSFDFDAQAYDEHNNPMFSNIAYVWSLVSGYGSINQNGLFEASDITGTAIIQIEASSGGLHRFDTATITITGGTVISDVLSYVVVTPQIVHLEPGQSVDFDAQAYDINGFPISASYTWDVINSSAGSVSQSGYLNAGYTVGSYYNAVRVRAYKDGVERSDYADVVIRSVADQNYYLNANLSAIDENGGDVRPSDVILYTLTLTNYQDNRLTNVKTTLSLPEYTTFISVTSNNGSPGISGRTIVWNIGDLNVGETNILNLRVKINQDISTNRIISAKAFVSANELDNGFWVWANNLQIEGGTDIPYQPLTPTGAIMNWILAAIVSLLATILTRRILHASRLVRN